MASKIIAADDDQQLEAMLNFTFAARRGRLAGATPEEGRAARVIEALRPVCSDLLAMDPETRAGLRSVLELFEAEGGRPNVYYVFEMIPDSEGNLRPLEHARSGGAAQAQKRAETARAMDEVDGACFYGAS